MKKTNKYDFSYVALSLAHLEMAKIASLERNGEEISYADFGYGKVSTGKRKLRDIKKRLSYLNIEQTRLLIDGDIITQKQMSFLAICKTHLFIRDFAIEVLREKLLVFDNELSEGEYLSFFRKKSDLFPQLDDLTEKSQKKIKQVTFKILEQAELIDDVKNKMIQSQILDNEVIQTILSDNPEWLKIFLIGDLDIANFKQLQ